MSATRLPLLDCPHAGECGGCTRAGEPYDAQLAFKRARVAQAFARYPELSSLRIESVSPASPHVAYRTRAKLVVGPRGELGLFARGGGHRVLDIPSCKVLCPSVASAVSALRETLRNPPAEAGAALVPASGTRRGALRAVDVREVAGEGPGAVLVTLVLAREARVPDHALAAAGAVVRARVRGAVSVAASFHDARSPQLLGGDLRILAGVETARDRVGARSGAYQRAAHGSFVQAHRGQAEKIHGRILDALANTGRAPAVLELYAGSGAIGLPLAARGARVTLVESFAPAVAWAEQAAREQGIDGVRAIAGDAEATARSLRDRGERFDAVVVNPPRRGTPPGVRECVAALAPAVVVYVSCDPETLARDLAHLARLGYSAGGIAPFDMIPHTDEVETVAVLRKSTPTTPPVVFADDDVVVVDKPPFERAGESLLARVRERPGFQSAVLVRGVDNDASGLCVFAADETVSATWRAALAAEDARVEALAVVRGIARDKGAIARPLPGNPAARTRYKRLRVVAGQTLVRVVAEPGAPGQARQHLASIDHPVLGDLRAGHAPSNRHALEKYSLERPFFHATRVACKHPRTGVALEWKSELPGDLATVLARMESAAEVASPPPDRE